MTPNPALAPLVHKALGHPVEGVTRLRGGSKKGAYRLEYDVGSTVICYVWHHSENHWSHLPEGDPVGDPFADASGIDLFEAAHGALTGLGVRTPRIHHLGSAGTAGDYALVEDIRGGTLDALLERDPRAARAVMAGLSDVLAVLHGHAGRGFGKVALVDSGRAPQGRRCEALAHERALVDLAEAAGRMPRIAAVCDEVAALLGELRAAVVPRSSYGLVHGELGPDHVLVDDDGRPVLIDIEGLMYFDPEWEHAFLRMRFHGDYAALHRPGLDPERLRLYALAQHLSLVAGPLRLLDGGFPEREAMRGIAEHNAREVVAAVAGGRPLR